MSRWQAEPDALPRLSFPTDNLADALELLRHALVRCDDFVEGIGDLAVDPKMVAGHSRRESPLRIA